MSPYTATTESKQGRENRLLRMLIDALPDGILVKDLEGRLLMSNFAGMRLLGAGDANKLDGRTDFDSLCEHLAQPSHADKHAVMLSGLYPDEDEEETIMETRTGETRYLRTSKIPLYDDDGEVVGLVAISKDITELKKTEAALRQVRMELEERIAERTAELSNMNAELAHERLLLRTLIDNLPDGIYAKDTGCRKIMANPADLKSLRCNTEAEAIGKSDFDLFPHDIAAKFFADDQKVIQTGEPVINREEYYFDEDGQKCWLLTSKLPMRNSSGEIVGLVGIGRDITCLKAAERKLESVHGELRVASRRAGMAEVATGVLHNVGNVLNSVNVSAALVDYRLRDSKVVGVSRLADLFREHASDMGHFLTEDERGRHLPAYLEQLSKHLEKERTELRGELEGLMRNIEHIKEIVATQQNYAHVSGVMEIMALPDLVEDALKIHSGAFVRHGVTVIREYEELPAVSVDKHRVLQILVNLLSNAKYACDAAGKSEKRVIVRITSGGEGKVRIEVEDNGEGIAEENLTRIFSMGFTTKKNGHGFGLHGGALAARELGGSLSVHSGGPGHGAVFTLEFPAAPGGKEQERQ